MKTANDLFSLVHYPIQPSDYYFVILVLTLTRGNKRLNTQQNIAICCKIYNQLLQIYLYGTLYMFCQDNNLTYFPEKQQYYHVEGISLCRKMWKFVQVLVPGKFCSVIQECHYVGKSASEMFFVTIILALLSMKNRTTLHNSLAQLCLFLPIFHYSWDIYIVYSP